MATPKRWSRTVGTQRGNRIRVYEREPGGKLYAAVWDPERHKYTQTGLGHRDRERALRDVGELVRLRESGDDLSGPLKLGTMVARYLAESIHTRDGSLKTAQYMKGCAQFATYLIEWFGAETRVSGSLETLLRYQLKRALPSSPREFLGWGNWFVSTFSTGPTT